LIVVEFAHANWYADDLRALHRKEFGLDWPKYYRVVTVHENHGADGCVAVLEGVGSIRPAAEWRIVRAAVVAVLTADQVAAASINQVHRTERRHGAVRFFHDQPGDEDHITFSW